MTITGPVATTVALSSSVPFTAGSPLTLVKVVIEYFTNWFFLHYWTSFNLTLTVTVSLTELTIWFWTGEVVKVNYPTNKKVLLLPITEKLVVD